MVDPILVNCTAQESLGGNAKTTLVVAVADAQEHAEETFNSLQFGARAMCVQTQVRRPLALRCE